MAAQAKKTTAKRKTTARKTTAKRKPAAKAKVDTSLQTKVGEASRDAFLASLGFYGMAFDQVQDQLKSVETTLSSRRKKADKLYRDMVKRGQKVEKSAKSAIDDLELPNLELASFDRAAIDARIEKAKARFEQLKETVGIKAAA